MIWAALGTVVLLAALKVAHDTRAYARACRDERMRFEDYLAWHERRGIKAPLHAPETTHAPSLATADGACGELAFDEHKPTAG